MNIGFDLDKVFINSPPFIPSRVIEWLYKEKDNGVLSYRIPSRPEQLIRHLTHHPLLRPPISENLLFLEKLTQKNTHSYFLISSRFEFLKNRTENLVKRHKLNTHFKELFFNYDNEQPHVFKDKIIKKQKIHKYIDDDLSLLKYVAKLNPTTNFFWFNPSNQQQLTKNIQGITHLSQIFQ